MPATRQRGNQPSCRRADQPRHGSSKPYAASGNYINRMSTYCKGCRYNPKQRTGPSACPFNILYWDFLARHAQELRRNPRMALVMKQLERIPDDELAAIRAAAAAGPGNLS